VKHKSRSVFCSPFFFSPSNVVLIITLGPIKKLVTVSVTVVHMDDTGGIVKMICNDNLPYAKFILFYFSILLSHLVLFFGTVG
jgi:hypothetical protein